MSMPPQDQVIFRPAHKTKSISTTPQKTMSILSRVKISHFLPAHKNHLIFDACTTTKAIFMHRLKPSPFRHAHKNKVYFDRLHKTQVHFDPHNDYRHKSQVNFDPNSWINSMSNVDPHSKIKSVSTSRHKNRVNFDHPDKTKSISIPHTEIKLT